MGVYKLTKFVDNHFRGWKKSPVKGKLIIDGHSLSYALLNSGAAQGERIYGGDYISFATQLNDFFETLLNAEINPLVVLDGHSASKKVAGNREEISKARLKIVIRLYYDGTLPSNVVPKHVHIKPFLLFNLVVDSVRRVLGDHRLLVADGDADADITSLAIHHQCPVLSSDGDFYVFPLLYGYIPYSRFHWRNAKNKVIYGEFYSYQRFCEEFRIHDPSLLTVIPVIVGNDAITKLNEDTLKIILPEHCNTGDVIENAVRYVATFTTFDSCLTSLRKQKLFGMIKSIENAHHDYFFLPLFKPRRSLATSLCCKDGSPLPEFILKLHRKGISISKMLRVCKFKFGVVLEDVLSESWCRLIGLSIRKVIYGILCRNDACIWENQRRKCAASYEEVEIKIITHVTYDNKQIPLPTLQSCGSEIDKEYGKKILFGTLDATVEDFENIPQDYHLLLVITRYWYKHCTIDEKHVLLESFLILLQLSKENKTRKGHKSIRLLDEPMELPFQIVSFVHAFAQWQTLYHDIQPLNELLQVPLKLLPISEFLECSYLYYLVKAVMKEGNSFVIEHYHLNKDVYQEFYTVTYQS